MFHSADNFDVPHSPTRDARACRGTLGDAHLLWSPTSQEKIVSTDTWHQRVQERHRQENSYYPGTKSDSYQDQSQQRFPPKITIGFVGEDC
jgi:hypothetical protein